MQTQMQTQLRTQLASLLKESKLKSILVPKHSEKKGLVKSSPTYMDDTIEDGYNQTRMGYEFKDYCIPEFVIAGPWAKHRVKIVQACPATWSRINSQGDKVYKRRACTFGESAAHSRETSNYKGIEISNLYASKLLIQDTFRELAKIAPTTKAAALDKKYKASLSKVEFLWEPKQKY